MAKQTFTQKGLWIGGYDFAGHINEVAIAGNADVLECSTLSDLWKRKLGGAKNVAWSAAGYYDGVDIDPQLFGNLGVADVPVTHGAQGIAVGDVAYFFRSIETEYDPLNAEFGEMLKLSIAGDISQQEGKIQGKLLQNATETSSGNTAEVLVKAVAAGETLYAVLHVLAASGGSPTLDAIVQSDTTGFPSPTSRITFAQATGISSQFLTLTTPITDTFYRVNFTIGGSTPSFLFVVAVGVK